MPALDLAPPPLAAGGVAKRARLPTPLLFRSATWQRLTGLGKEGACKSRGEALTRDMLTKLSGVLMATLIAAACSKPAGRPPVANYDSKTGKLTTLSVDTNRNGKVDAVSYMDGTRILRIEVDQDENGRVDRWDFYGPDKKLERVGFSRENDGVMDAVAYYQSEGVLSRMEVSTRRDGTFDRIERYQDGRLVETAEDTDGDGRHDKWDEYGPSGVAGVADAVVVSTKFDDSKSGRPERRFVYGHNGAIARVEFDRDGDGMFTSAAPSR